MRDLVEYMARALVDQPEAVTVREHRAGHRTVYHLQVAEADMGKVIGKQGRIANAMRALLKVAAARSGERAVLEIG
ncbi:MAG TPA: KH domain-containing protein [Dehalococcoidia bacterium]